MTTQDLYLTLNLALHIPGAVLVLVLVPRNSRTRTPARWLTIAATATVLTVTNAVEYLTGGPIINAILASLWAISAVLALVVAGFARVLRQPQRATGDDR
jgi:hypothetical protein